MHKDSWYFFATFQPSINWCEKGKKFALYIVSGKPYKYCKVLALLTPIYWRLECPKKVQAILVHQGAPNWPAVKVFFAPKSGHLLHKTLDFDATKILMAGNFAAS